MTFCRLAWWSALWVQFTVLEYVTGRDVEHWVAMVLSPLTVMGRHWQHVATHLLCYTTVYVCTCFVYFSQGTFLFLRAHSGVCWSWGHTSAHLALNTIVCLKYDFKHTLDLPVNCSIPLPFCVRNQTVMYGLVCCKVDLRRDYGINCSHNCCVHSLGKKP